MSSVPGPAVSDPIRLVQIGAGAMGRSWLSTVRDSPDTQLVALVDLDRGRAVDASTAAGLSGIEIGTTLSDVLGRVPADAVINVTAPEAHAETTIDALLRGLPVLCEKPAAHTLSAALSMAAAAEVSGRLLMVSQSRRYWRNLDSLRAQVGLLGTLGLVECSFYRAPHFGGFRDQMPYPLLTDMAIHHFDLARDLIGSEPVRITCESFNPAWSWFTGDAAAQVGCEFADGTRFAFTGSWCSPGLETSWNGTWRISGSGGTATWDGDHAPVAVTAGGEAIEAAVGSGPEQIAGSLAEFVGALRTDSVPWGEVHRNVKSLAMVEGAIRSAQTRQRVVLDDLLEEARGRAIDAEQRPEIGAALAAW